MTENGKELEAEPKVIEPDGSVSDESEHAPILANDIANKMSDSLAWSTGKSLGFSDDELKKMLETE